MSKSNFQKGDRAKQFNNLSYLENAKITASVNKTNGEITLRIQKTNDSELNEEFDVEIILVPKQEFDC